MKHKLYMDIARRVAQESHAERNKVGAVMVKDGNIISMGYNGTPSGRPNQCEEPQYLCNLNEDKSGCDCPEDRIACPVTMVTKPEVLHAELNLLAKVARSTSSSEDATVYVTLSPCIECAKQLLQSGVSEIIYDEKYQGKSGIGMLVQSGIKVWQLKGRKYE